MCADQATLSTEERSEQAMESVTTETEPSASQTGATTSMSNQSSGSSLSRLTPSTTTAEARQLNDTNAALSNPLADIAVKPSISGQSINKSESTKRQIMASSVIATDIADTGDSRPSISSVTVSDITDAKTETESQKSSPLVTVRDIAGFKSDSQSSGSSPKRKASEGEDTAGRSCFLNSYR